MWRSIHLVIFIGVFLFSLIGCGGDQATKELNYDTTKKMVIDILQTEEGKKALSEMMAEDKMKEKLVMDSDIVHKAINQALASEKGKKVWEKLFEDPTFVKSYAESMNDSLKKLMKDLMKDAAFQKQMIELLQNPEMEAQLLKVMRSQKYNEHLEASIQKTFDSPLFQAKIQEILLKAAETQRPSNKNGNDGGGSGSDDGGGNESSDGS